MTCHPRIGKRNQRQDLPSVLFQSTIAYLGQTELLLDHPKQMLNDGAVVMHLQTETGTGVDNDAIDLKARTEIDAVVPAPGATDFAVAMAFTALLLLELGDDFFDFLYLIFIGNEDGIGGFDNDGVIKADAGDETAVA